MTYANATDVATRLGRTFTPEETSLVNTRLADAERRILRRIPTLAAKITAGTIDVADVVQVEADAVLRLVRNPDGYASEQDGSYGYTFSRETASGKLEILPSEWATLGVKRPVSQLVPTFSVAPTPTTLVHPFMAGG
jgi:hypothetical protein